MTQAPLTPLTQPIRVGLIGAGYIAPWHADAIRATPGVTLTAVCDQSASAAAGLAAGYGVAFYTDLNALIAAGVCDAVHILTPPGSHHDLTLQCLNAGLHCFVEKPFALGADDARAMADAARNAGRHLAVGHNFLALPGYTRLKAAVSAGDLGRITSAQVTWALPLAPLRAGPFGLWLLRDRDNLLLELGPHLYALIHDLFGMPEILHVELDQPVDLPGGGSRPQSWRVLARARGVQISLTLSLVETYDDRSITLRGSGGMARFDFAADTLITTRDNTADLVVNPLRKELSQAWQHLREGVVNATRQAVSLNQKSPYGLSFRGAVGSFYDSLRTGRAVDPRFSADSAVAVMGAIDATLRLLPKAPPLPAPLALTTTPTVMVIGGTGFIGRNLTRALAAKGYGVRVLSRGRTGPFDDISDRVETVPVSLGDEGALAAAMQGIDTVFNLAKSTDTSWEAALQNDVATAERIGRAALAAGVRRLIYTGTIASYDMSDPARKITEAVGFAEDMTDRNLYARSKAECERRLIALQRDAGLPLIIARPGIVVGAGGPLQHWGIGRWHGAGAVRVWGDGRNTLPFVLADDTSDALIAMMEIEAALGQSFNIVGAPMFSARGYFDAIHQALGAKITVSPGNLTALWLADGLKYTLKRHVLRKQGLARPSLRDWKSRAHLSKFDNTQAKRVLGWEPEADRARFVERAIGRANILGF